MPDTMLAVTIEGQDPERPKSERVRRPEAGPGQVLMAVHAAGVNRGDLELLRMGRDPMPGSSQILGLEVSGEVVVGCGRWKPGDRVCALLRDGGYAEFAAVDARHVLPVPPGLSSIEAAALPEALVTIYANVFEHGALKPGEIFVTHGANSGIGAMAIQMAKAAGATVIATARGPKKAAFARELGADVAVDLLSERFEDAAKALGGAHLILEMVGGDAFAANIDAVRLGGRIVVIGRMSHAATSLPLARLMQKQAVITGSLLRPRSTEEKGRLVSALEERFWPVVSGGGIKAMIDCVYPLAEVAAAHSRLRSGAHMGKIVLTCS